MNGPTDATSNSSLLQRLAEMYGIATTHCDWRGNQIEISPSTIISILQSRQVDISDSPNDAELKLLLEQAELRPWTQILPSCVVMRMGSEYFFPIHLPDGTQLDVNLNLEDGSKRQLTQVDVYVPPREVQGVLTGRATFLLPRDLPLGWHTVVAEFSDGSTYQSPVAVVPEKLETTLTKGNRYWGISSQIYSTLSQNSWGIGDLSDLCDVATFAGKHGADFVLINPIHASEPVPPISNSPYLPTSRQFLNPIYLRPESIPEIAGLTPRHRMRVANLAAESREGIYEENSRLDRDKSWQAKLAALKMIYEVKRSYYREESLLRFRKEEGEPLENFALWCALTEEYGPELPPDFNDPNSEYIFQEKVSLEDRIAFYIWLQWEMHNQVTALKALASNAGLSLGIMYDLAVGVHPHGSDVWCSPDSFARDMGVGAPPDDFNQQGQNWSQPPMSPDVLEKLAYAPFRSIVRSALRYAGAVRIDHIMGLFRLWWIPQGAQASAGTYVSYDHEAMVGILLLEAQRAGAIVIGEDLGTVEPWVREYLMSRGIKGTAVAWFEKDADNKPLYPQDYRSEALAAVNIHDLPPTAAYLDGTYLVERDRLKLLSGTIAANRAADIASYDLWISRLNEVGIVAEGQRLTTEEFIIAVYRYVASSAAQMVAVALVDAVGEKRSQNIPGTDKEYPNWKIPLGDAAGHLVCIEDLLHHARALRLFQAVHQIRS